MTVQQAHQIIELINTNSAFIPLADESAQCCITSPPYYGLRDYGTASWEGGSGECDHKQGRNGAGRADGIVDERAQRNRDGVGSMGGDCGKCGARRIDSQIGLEDTPEAYVAKLVAVFREVGRVLRDDGTLWLVLGDSYASNPASGGIGQQEGGAHQRTPKRLYTRPPGLKPKDLMMMPARVALALQADGWYLRSDIIWHKPNPMPESMTDRPTKSHEYVFLLTKQAHYHYDAQAIAEKSIWADKDKRFITGPTSDDKAGAYRQDGLRNKRSVWTVSTESFSGAHFATFPQKLVEPMVLAGSRRGDIVLDPFAGSGTVGQVCARLGRSFVGLELKPDYIELARARMNCVQIALPWTAHQGRLAQA